MSTNVPVEVIRSNITTTNTTTGLVLSAGTVGASNATTFSFSNPDGKVFLRVSNANVGASSILVAQSTTIDGLTVNGLTVTVPASGTVLAGPFSNQYYTQQTGTDVGKTTFTCGTNPTDLTIWALRY